MTGRRPRDREFAFLKRVLTEFETFDPDVRVRMLDYLNARVPSLPKEAQPQIEDGADEDPPLIRHIKSMPPPPERPKPGKSP